jgi:hypothetical protein
VNSAWNKVVLALFLPGMALLSGLSFAQSAPSALNISGGLYDASGNAILNNNVSFKLEVWDKAGTCALYSEVHPVPQLQPECSKLFPLLGRSR